MDCQTAGWVSVSGGVVELLGIVTVAVDLRLAGRVPDLQAFVRRLGRRRPRVVHGQANVDLRVHGVAQGQRVEDVRLNVDTNDVAGQLRQLERRLEELRGDLEREATARAEADARLERSIRPTLQSLQNQLTDLQRELQADRARARSHPWVAWVGILLFVAGLWLAALGAFMAINCT
jgi:hypothetical protein